MPSALAARARSGGCLTVGDLELGQDVAHVVGHGLVRQEQPARDRPIAEPVGEQVQHLDLPIGLLRGSRRAHWLGFGLLGALLAFDSVKIVVFHEGAGYLFACLTVLGLSLQAAPSTRSFVR